MSRHDRRLRYRLQLTSYLRQLPVDALKIDRSFVQTIATGTQSMALIRTLTQLDKTLGLKTIAEGIEDLVRLRQLEAEQCDHDQGYLFSRPLERGQLTDFLHRREDRTLDNA